MTGAMRADLDYLHTQGRGMWLYLKTHNHDDGLLKKAKKKKKWAKAK